MDQLVDTIIQGIESHKTNQDIMLDCLYPQDLSEDDLLVMALLEEDDLSQG